MKLSVSDRAWRPHEEKRSLEILNRHGVDGVSLSFLRLEQNVRRACQSIYTVARAHKKRLSSSGMSISCIEQIADSRFGNWADADSRAMIFERFHTAVDVASEIGVQNLNLTTPSLMRSNCDIETLEDFSLDWECLIQRAETYGISLFIEPTPRIYGSKFWQDTQQVFESFNMLDLDIKIGLDSTALSFEQNPRSSLIYWAGQSPVFSVSEPSLSPILPAGPVPHKKFSYDLSRLALQGRTPEWLVLRYDRTLSHPFEGLNDNLKKVRVLYSEAFRKSIYEDY